MNASLTYDYLKLRPAVLGAIIGSMEIHFQQYAHETNLEFSKRFLTHVQNEGKLRELEQLVIEYS